MNQLAIMNNQQTMSSLEIAKLTGKEHKNVLADIRKVLAEVDISSTDFSAVYKDQQLIDRPCFNLPFRETNLIVAGYSAQHRLAIIDRWQELESKTTLTLPDFTDPAEAAIAWAAEFKAKQAALAQIESDKPKVVFAEIVGEDSNTRCIRHWVKAMKHENNLVVGEREVFKWLVDGKYIFRSGKSYLPYSKYEANGKNYFTVVVGEVNGRPCRQLQITGKGVVALTSKVVKAFKV